MPPSCRLPLFVVLSCLALVLPSACGQLIISEFLASNSTSLADEDGDNSDWIEIRNTTSTPVNLLGWYLTDNKNQPRKWALPNRTMTGNTYLVVFASNKDRKPASGNLHTNFKLSSSPSYLALCVDTPGGGVQVVHSFDPYPEQLNDVSYGTSVSTTVTSLVAVGANAKALVPTVVNGGSSLGTGWTGASAGEPFDDSGWISGTTGAGLPSTGIAAANLKNRLNFDTPPVGTAVADSSVGNHPATNTGVLWSPLSIDAGAPVGIRDGVMQFGALDSNGGQTGDILIVPAHADFNATVGTISFWMRCAGLIGPGSEATIWDRRSGGITGQGAAITLRDDGLLTFRAADGTAVRCQFNSTVSVMNDRWHHVAFTYTQAAGGSVTCYVDGVARGAGTNQTPSWSWSAAQQIEIGRSHDTTWRRYDGELDDVRFYDAGLSQSDITTLAASEADAVSASDIGLNLQAAMQGVNSSAFLRVPFNLTDPNVFTSLNLTMRWCDGYVAYLNGVPTASFAAPETVTWNSASTATHSAGSVQTVSLAPGSLRAGANILAIQLLNNSAANGTAFLSPKLDGVTQTFSAAGYLMTKTPAANNGSIRTNVGPFISNVTKNPSPRPTGTAASPPLIVTAVITPSLRPLDATAPAVLRYRIMYGGEQPLNMKDDGVAPDAVANDSIFTAQIPTNTIGTGQMLRWRVVAKDNTNITSTAPLYLDTADNDQYFGTTALNSTIESSLPVLYFFVSDTNAPNNEVGTRCSIFFKAPGDTSAGRFYDNVEVNQHGQSSANFTKKSYDLDFNEDNRFEWNANGKKVKDVNLLTNYGDKSKTHNALTHESLAAIGAPHHWCYQVRVQQVTTGNATTPTNHFFSIADMMEDGDDDWLDRIGKDPNGALYKIYDSLTGGGEKKTRKFEGSTDLQALVSGLNPGSSLDSRRLYSYDNLDLADCVSYFVGLAIASSQDHGHKNYYVYRDSLGTRAWSIFAWDTDLTWGRNWTDANGYFTDTIYTDNPLNFYPGYNDGGTVVQNKGTMNRLYTIMFDAPEFRRMYLRRLRTVMDQYLQPPGTVNGIIDTRVTQMTDLMDPPLIGTSDADRDRTKWGTWGSDGGNTLGGAVLRYHTNILKNTYLTGRRAWLNSAAAKLFYTGGNEAIPTSQPANAADGISIQTIDFNPTSGNQEHEYFVLRNSNSYAVDISGWQITGAVNLTFKGGTVIPAGGGVTQHIGDLFVAKNPFLFRQRTAAPSANQFCFVAGPYSGQLSARGETLELRDATGVLLKNKSWTPSATAAQNQLRITELNYAPSGPTNAERNAIQGVVESDFEYIELMNIGATPLNLGGASFDQGVNFTFPAGYTLAAGARCLVVANHAAFALRYGNSQNAIIAGQFDGQLDNNGETIQLRDAVGELVLDFRYEASWFPPSDEGGRSLVVRDPAGTWQEYDLANHWALSGEIGGTPGLPESDVANVYEGWRWDYFAAGEMPTEAQSNLPAALTQDPEGDGLMNLGEYAFGRNAKAADNTGLTEVQVINDAGVDYLAMSFRRRHKALDLTYVVEASSDLANWVTVTTQFGAAQDLGNGVERVTVRDSQPYAAQSKRWMRVRAMKP